MRMLQGSFVWVLVLGMLAVLPVFASTYADGIKLYNLRQYKAAAAVFEQIIQSRPRYLNAVYYCAVSQQYANNAGRAKQLYQFLNRNFPLMALVRIQAMMVIK